MERIQILSNHLTSARSIDKSKLKTPSSFNYYELDDLLSDEDRSIRYRAKEFCENELSKVNLDEYYDKAEFPFEVIEKLKKLNWVGATIKGYGCASELTPTSLGLITMELAKVSADLATFYGILLNITMLPIYYCGSEEQKKRFLPDLASMNKIGAFALTEPNAGSDAAGLQCKAKKVDGGWLLTGEKRWIGNAPFADVIVVWARNVDTNKIHGFIVQPKVNTKNIRIETIKNKIALRSVQNGHIYFDNYLVKEEDRLPLAKDFNSGPGKCLFLTRTIVAYVALGIASNAYEKCLEYVKNRKQFGQPLAQFQLVQERLVKMLGNIQGIALMCLRVSKLYENQKLTLGQAGLLKAYSSSKAREVVSLARELFGGNGILMDQNGIGRNFVDIEAVYTYEGTYDVNTLVAGREITGFSAISQNNFQKK